MCLISPAREILGYWTALSGPSPEQLLLRQPSSSESSWLSKAPHASAAARDANKPLCLPCTPDEPMPFRCSPRSTSLLLLTTQKPRFGGSDRDAHHPLCFLHRVFLQLLHLNDSEWKAAGRG